MLWLADGDPIMMDKFRRMPLVGYYTILDAKIAQVKEQMKDVGNNRR